MISLDMVYDACNVLKTVVHMTDIIHANKLFNNKEVYLKTENLQVTGSFKLRGAYYKISQLNEEEKKSGIIACSAGNHAQGVAFASNRFNIKSKIYMPSGAPISKVEATKSYGSSVCLVDGVYDDAYKKAVEDAKISKATFIHPFNDYQVIAGQGTIAIEVLKQIEDLEQIIVPIGGGGLISGVAFVIKSINPKIKVIGVQASNAASMVESINSKKIKELNIVNTFADGIAVKCPGDITYDLISKYVDDLVTVTEDEIATSILSLIEKQKIISEGAGAVSVAAALFDKVNIENKKTVCLVSGGNIDVNILSRVIKRGLVAEGRTCMLKIAVEDRPGQLEIISRIISDSRANVISVNHEQSDVAMAINSCYLTIGLETRDFEHIKEIKANLINAGYNLVNN